MTAAERLAELEEGEVVDGPILFPGLMPSKEISAAVMKKNEQGVVSIELSFAGIVIGKIAGKAGEGGKVTWWEDKGL